MANEVWPPTCIHDMTYIILFKNLTKWQVFLNLNTKLNVLSFPFIFTHIHLHLGITALFLQSLHGYSVDLDPMILIFL